MKETSRCGTSSCSTILSLSLSPSLSHLSLALCIYVELVSGPVTDNKSAQLGSSVDLIIIIYLLTY